MIAAANLRPPMDSTGWRELIDGTIAPSAPFTFLLLSEREEHSLVHHPQLALPSTLP